MKRIAHGFTLIEIMIAIVILAVVLMTLTGLSVALATRSVRNAGRSFETGVLTQEVDRVVAMPIDSLALHLGESKLDTPVTTPWLVARNITISGRADSVSVRIAILPLQAKQTADSVTQTVIRTR